VSRDVLLRRALEAETEHVHDELVVLAVGEEIVGVVLVVAVLQMAPRPFPLGGLPTVGAGDVLGVLVAVLLGHDERDAEQHLARRVVREHEPVGKLDVHDVAVVEHVDDFAALPHVARKAVWRPRDDALVFDARLEVVQHRAKLRASVGHHGGLFLVDNLDPTQPEAVGERLALPDLVADGAFLLLRRVGALADVDDVFQTLRALRVAHAVFDGNAGL